MTTPTCTCGPGRIEVCCDIRNEPHFVGCPRWGTRLSPEVAEEIDRRLVQETITGAGTGRPMGLLHLAAEPTTSMRINTTYKYDAERGELHAFDDWGPGLRQVIEVRARLEEDALLAVVIIELERRGYAVIPPGRP